MSCNPWLWLVYSMQQEKKKGKEGEEGTVDRIIRE